MRPSGGRPPSRLDAALPALVAFGYVLPPLAGLALMIYEAAFRSGEPRGEFIAGYITMMGLPAAFRFQAAIWRARWGPLPEDPEP